MAQASDECLHELNPAGGFARQHSRLCGVISCADDAVVHVRVVDRGWCGNVCRRCQNRISSLHRVRVSEMLMGLGVNDGREAGRSEQRAKRGPVSGRF